MSLLVDPNSNTTIQTTDNSSETSNKALRKLSRMQKSNVKKASSNKHVYGKVVHWLTDGDHFGEESLLQKEEVAPFTVQTNMSTELLTVPGYIFDRCLHNHFQEILLKRARFLSGLEWFEKWNPHLIRQLAFMLREKQYRFNDCLFRQEMESNSVQFIQSGAIKLSTHFSKKPPEELVEKIHPPKNHVADILAEDLAKEAPKKVSIFGRSSKRSSTLLLPATTNTSSRRNSMISQSRSTLQVESVSAVPMGAPQAEESKRKIMGFVTHPPNPNTNLDICILGPGDALCSIEAICKLQQHLFNAVCISDTIVYELNRFYFKFMFEDRLPRTLYQMVLRAIHRVTIWSDHHDCIQLFHPLKIVLEQIEEELTSQGASKRGRKKPLYTADMLAFTAVKGLGKKLVKVNSDANSESTSRTLSLNNVQILTPHTSSLSSPLQSTKRAIPRSPFEPDLDKIPFSEFASCPFPPFGPRKDRLPSYRDNEQKTIFDSPCDTRYSTMSHSKYKNSIPVPLPYITESIPAEPAVQVKFSSMTNRNESNSETPIDEKKEILSDINSRNLLANIRRQIISSCAMKENQFSAENFQAPSSSHKVSVLKSSLKKHLQELPQNGQTSQKAGRCISACERVTTSDVIRPPRPKSHGCLPREKMPLHVHFMVRKRYEKKAVSKDSEVTQIPKEYSSLLENYDDKRSESEASSNPPPGLLKYDSHSLPPYVKTMVLTVGHSATDILTK